MAESFTQRVREAAFDKGEFSIDDIAEVLSIHTYDERQRIGNTIRELRKRKEIVLIRPGLNRYQGKQKPLTQRAKMWRAMRIKGHFTQQNIVRLSGASISNMKRYFHVLKKEGHITHISGQGYKGSTYRLMDPDNAPLEHPRSPN